MPGVRGSDERSATINVRLTIAEKEKWERHIRQHGGYLAAMIRHLVNDHLHHSSAVQKCAHWE